MMIVETFNLNDCLSKARKASRKLASSDRNKALYAIADALEKYQTEIIQSNAKDVALERQKGTKDSLIDRLTLNEKRLTDIAESVRLLAKFSRST